MKNLNQDNINQSNDRILSLVAELNSTLDLYYESDIENEVGKNDQWIIIHYKYIILTYKIIKMNTSVYG